MKTWFFVAGALLAGAGAAPVAIPAAAETSQVKIVGIGATDCGQFARDATTHPPSQRAYLAWMQGYMSGIMIGRPQGSDENIDLTPKAFPLAQQTMFIRDYCLASPSASFAEAVEALYKKLRSRSFIGLNDTPGVDRN